MHSNPTGPRGAAIAAPARNPFATPPKSIPGGSFRTEIPRGPSTFFRRRE
jgi:hypothetical protein